MEIHTHTEGKSWPKKDEGSRLPQNEECQGLLTNSRNWKREEVILPWSPQKGGFPDWERIHFCCLRHPVCGALFQQPQETNMAAIFLA